MQRLFDKHGLGYVMRLPELATELAVDRLARSRGELHGELVVTSGLPGTRSSDGHLHQARFNLSGSEARNRVAKTLAVRANTRDEIDWTDVLEDFCRRVLAAEREGEPIEFAGDRPQRLAPPWRLDPILAADKPTILYGSGGTGKSTLATAIAVSVETGVMVVPGWIPRRAPVLYLDWETTVDDVDEHVKGIAAAANIPGAIRIRYRRCYGPLADQTEELVRIVTEHGIGLVVVDSVALAAGSGSEGSEASEGAIRLFSAFRLLGTTVLALAHIAKADSNEPGRAASPYGSVFYTNLARATFELRRSAGPDDVARLGVYNTKSNVRRPLPPIGLEVRQEDGGSIAYDTFSITDDATLSRRLSVWDRARAALADSDMHEEELAEQIEVDEKVIRTTLNRVAKSGLVERLPSSKKWRLIHRAS